MNRDVAEDNWRQKFEALGLSEGFDLLYRDWSTDRGRRCGIRCKKCGKEFKSYAVEECIRGRQKIIYCPECGFSSDGDYVHRLPSNSLKADEIIRYYTEGHSVKETTERFGLNKYAVNNLVKTRSVTNGRDWRAGCAEANQRRIKEAEERWREKLDGMGFVYIGGYEKKCKGHLEVRCKSCGYVFTRWLGAFAGECFDCPECRRVKEAAIRDAKQKEQEQLKVEQAEERRQIREQEKQRAEAEKAEALFHLLNDKTHVCAECGKYFSIAECMESKGLKFIQHNPKYCSHECNRKALNRAHKRAPSGKTGNYYVRARKYGCEYVPGITLKKLVKRDGLKCQICGGMCDWSDHLWSEYSGPTYPSIDHIIPLAKGGSHTWGNVQVAHLMCNSLKGDR